MKRPVRRRHVPALVGVLLALASLISTPKPAQAATWTEVSSNCVSGGVTNWSVYTRCWGKKKLNNDGQATKQYHSLRMTISGNAINGKFMSKLWVEPLRSPGTPTQYWAGSDPFQPDQTTTFYSPNCTTKSWTIGVGVAGVGSIAYTTTQSFCDTETFGPILYPDAGHHAGVWSAEKGHRAPDGRVEKAVAMVSVRTAEGPEPIWDVSRYGANTHYTQES